MIPDILKEGWVGTLVGVFGIVIAVILYWRSKRQARWAYRFRVTNVVGGSQAALPKRVEIRFDGDPVPCISKCQVVLWNAGTVTVRGLDAVERDPPRIVLPESSSILDARVAKVTRPVNALIVARIPGSPNSVSWSFDFADPRDGCVVELLHTGDAVPPQILGTIRGIPQGFEDRGRLLEPNIFKLMLGAVAMGFITLGLALVEQRPLPSPLGWPMLLTLTLQVVVGLLLLLILIAALRGHARRFPKALNVDP